MAKKKKNSKKKRNLLLAIGVGILSFFLAFSLLIGYFVKTKGADFLSNLASLSRKNTEINMDEDKISFEKEDDESLTSENKLPESFPEDLPIYPEAILINSWTATGNNTEGLSVVWETKDNISEVSGYYKDELEKAGWAVSANFEEESSTTITFEKDKISGFVGIAKGEEGSTLISVTLGIEK